MTIKNFVNIAATLLLFAFFFSSQLFAQQPNPSTLTLERIFPSREFAAEQFGPARCSKATLCVHQALRVQ
jgi:hypothetical protein